MNKKKLVHLLLGPALFALSCVALPTSVFATLQAKAAIGTVLWLAYWWVTRPVDLAVTAFLPVALNAFFNMTPMDTVIANYSSETIVLLFGSSILAVSLELTGLDKRIAARFLGIIGEKLRLQLVFWFLPIMIVLFVSNILFMLRNVKKTDSLPGSRDYFIRQYKELPPMKKEEKISLALFLGATILAFTRSLYQNLLPGFKPAYVFVLFAVLAFLITDGKGERILKWKQVQGKLVWELIFVFAGGLAAGSLINKSGAAEAIGTLVSGMGLKGGFFTVLAIVTVTVILSDVTSNTATASTALPIVISIVTGLGMDPVPWIYIATIGVNLSYMLPTSIRAIPVGYGLEPKVMLKEGWKMTVMVIVLMTVTAYLLLKYWGTFSTV